MSAAALWFFAGVALILAELLTPGFVIIFFGLGAWAAAAAALLTSSLVWQLTVFLIVSPASLFFLRHRFVNTFRGRTRSPEVNRPNFPHAGRHAEVLTPISPNSEGEIAFGGSFWRATSTVSIAAGSEVRVIAPTENDELLLLVEPLDKNV